MKYNKKCTIVLVLQILENNTDGNQPLSQSYIADFITDLGIPCDRKTVGRDIRSLQGIGYPIRRSCRGYYMDNMLITATEAKIVCRILEEAKPEGIDLVKFLPKLKKAMGQQYVF